jgi:acyl-coenzyme A synthetase/AMP-(fatty) acid ligase
MMFYVKNDKKISYDVLISDINGGTCDDFLSSLISSIVCGVEIDLSSDSLFNRSNNISDVNDLHDRIMNSKSTLLMKTSGTTGMPKTKLHKISDLLKNTKSLSGESAWLLTYNRGHMGGVQVILQALSNLDCLVDVYRMPREIILNLVKNQNVTHISATPTFYRMLLPFEESFSSVKRVTVGGERTDTQTLNLISKMFPGAKVNNIYATTETGAILFSNSEIFQLNDKVFVDKTLKVRMEDGTIHDTGDLVQMIDETRFAFCGRNSNIINVGGNNVNPTIIEDVLKSHEKIKDAVVYGRPNKLLGNVLVCDVVALKDISKEEIRNHIGCSIEQKYMHPRIIKFKDELKINQSNKVVR